MTKCDQISELFFDNYVALNSSLSDNECRLNELSEQVTTNGQQSVGVLTVWFRISFFYYLMIHSWCCLKAEFFFNQKTKMMLKVSFKSSAIWFDGVAPF